jgi:ribosomal RNA assembly protein
MSFEQTVKVPHERIGVIIGKSGETKKHIEETLGITLEIDSREGSVTVRSTSLEGSDPITAVKVIEAIGRGFSPERALRLRKEGTAMEIIDLREYAGKSENSLQRLRGRIIGLKGKSRRVIEELTGCFISVYGRTVAIIGEFSDVQLASNAVRMLASGSQHKTVYNMLERARSRKKLERMILWEGLSPEEVEKRLGQDITKMEFSGS